ncbi:hypothetical protein SELMODRAFT_445242 [Selaginella moellendorffii]|uniref:Uncharacterized protein n=1 Tax=Selaginella moellendorffii TaxID=88036 RepID=D8SH34_SELML|nr:hypothetical protein SELMODRAFT_445242 [Selaginella moellendorffii]
MHYRSQARASIAPVMEIISSRRGVGRCSSLGDHNRQDYPLFSPVLDWQEQQREDQLEFRFFSSSSCPSAAHGNCVEMISADEIFSNGRMLPCALDSAKNTSNKNLSMAMKRPNPHASTPPPAPPAAPMPAASATAANRSSSSSSSASGNTIRKKSAAMVATATCSSHWKEIFNRLRNPGRPRSSSQSSCYESSGSLSSDMDAFPSSTSSSSRRLLLLPDHHGEDFSLPLTKATKAKNSHRASSQQGMDRHDKSSSSRMMRVSSFDSRSSSRVYPGGGGGSGDHHHSQTSRRSFSRDHHRRSLSSFLYDQHQQHHQHHHRHQSVTSVLNMPVCMGDSLVASASSSSSGKLAKLHSSSSRAKRR